MKNLFLSVCFLLAMPTLSTHGMSSEKGNLDGIVIEEVSTICVPYRATNPSFPNDAHFYTLACAQVFLAVNPGWTLQKGNFCVDQSAVFACI